MNRPYRPKFFQNARVHHRHRGGGGGIGGCRPGMEREQGDQGAESGDQQGADQFRIFQGLSVLDEVLEAGEGEPGLRSDHQQGRERHHGGQPQVQGGAPGGGALVPPAVQADHHEGGDQRQFMEGEEGNNVVGQESAGGARGDQQGGVVQEASPPLRRIGAQNRGEGDQDGCSGEDITLAMAGARVS